MKSKIFQKVEQRQKLSPSQILTSKLLYLNQMSLEQRIIKELEKNPALELEDSLPSDEDEVEPVNDELADTSDDLDNEIDFDSDNGDGFDQFEGANDYKEDSADYIIPNRLSLSDKLLSQFQDLNPSKLELEIANQIIGNLDDGGYLAIDPIIISDRLQIELEEVIRVLDKIKFLDPPGMGSRDLRECLLSQLEANNSDDISYKILDKFFDDFLNRRYERIKVSLGVEMEQVREAMELISHLNPKPGEGAGIYGAQYIYPDVYAEKKEGSWVVSINDSNRFNLKLSQSYLNLLNHKDKKTALFAKQKINDAKIFINALGSRKVTMLRVVESILKFQKKYFETEGKKIKPLILKQIAEDIDMDISTVSRSTKEKYIQLPWGLVELKTFFSESMEVSDGEIVSSTEIKNRIKEIIDFEDKKNPLNDEKITSILNSEGYKIARRTVAKYREKVGILKAKMRREI